MKLERDDQQRACVLDRLQAQGFGAVGKSLAVEQPGDRVGRGRNGRPALTLEPTFRFVLKVDVSAPAEEDERNVESQRNGCDLSSRTEDDFGAPEFAEEVGAVSDEQNDGGHDGSENDPVVLGAVERRSASECETAREHKG